MSVPVYLGSVVSRLRELLGDRLVGVYPSGSLAFGAYRPGRSDLDLIAVAERPSSTEIAAITTVLSHEALPCPAAGLEFVLYDRTTLAGLTTGAGFALNLNTGRELPPKAETDPGDGPTFWYPIDRDMVCQQQRALTGPPFTELSPRRPYAELLPVVAESVTVQLDGILAHGDNAVLNGCRALRYHAERSWAAKPDAAAWALAHAPGFARVVTAALASHGRDRVAGQHVEAEPARAFLAYVLARCRS